MTDHPTPLHEQASALADSPLLWECLRKVPHIVEDLRQVLAEIGRSTVVRVSPTGRVFQAVTHPFLTGDLNDTLVRHRRSLDALTTAAHHSPEVGDDVAAWIRRATAELQLGCSRIAISKEGT